MQVKLHGLVHKEKVNNAHIYAKALKTVQNGEELPPTLPTVVEM
jgi:hypothetical protein